MRGGRENMPGLQLIPSKRGLTLAPSIHIYTYEQNTDRVSGHPLVRVCPMKPLTSLRRRDREHSGMLEAERGECVSLPDKIKAPERDRQSKII